MTAVTAIQRPRPRPARQSTVRIPHSRQHMYGLLARTVRPKPPLTVSDWADRHRILTSKGSGEPGPWRTSRTPYLREVMDHLSIRSPVQRVVMMFSAQIGKTEVGLNWLGYIMSHAPSPTLAVWPTMDVRQRMVKQRIDPLLTETPAIRKLFDGHRTRDASNTQEIKDFPGGLLVLSGANSPSSLAAMPIRNVLCDEIDRFPWDVGGEGDPLGLIDERTKTFPRRKVLLVSTPTLEGSSRIAMEYEQSDQRQYHVPCPDCGEYQVLHWKRPDGQYGLVHSETTGRVWYACAHCGTMIDETSKPKMLEQGRWIPRHPERPVRGYHLSGLYSPLGLGFSWTELWQKWQEAHRDTSNLKRFVNTTLGEVWKEQGQDLGAINLLLRREIYPDPPGPFELITAGIDIQKDRIEFTAIGWGSKEESWALDHVIVPGDTTQPAVWEELAEALDEASVQRACIDAGYNTDFVHSFCENRRWVIPTKGHSGNGPLIDDEPARRRRRRKQMKRAHRTEPVCADQGKAILYSRLLQTEPGPGYVHFPQDPAFDDEYFAQLGAERQVLEIKAGRPVHVWKALRPRNEALDCMVLALAARRLETEGQRRLRSQPSAEADLPPTTPSSRHRRTSSALL